MFFFIPLVPAEESDNGWQSDLMTDDAGTTTLWREVKEVMERGVGVNLSNEEMKLQQVGVVFLRIFSKSYGSLCGVIAKYIYLNCACL